MGKTKSGGLMAKLGNGRLELLMGGLVAILGGGMVMAMPIDALQDLVLKIGLPSIIPQFDPPLGMKAQALLAAAVAFAGFVGVWGTMKLVDKAAVLFEESDEDADDVFIDEAPKVRRRDRHPDAPARAPLSAARELGKVDAEDEDEAPRRRGLFSRKAKSDDVIEVPAASGSKAPWRRNREVEEEVPNERLRRFRPSIADLNAEIEAEAAELPAPVVLPPEPAPTPVAEDSAPEWSWDKLQDVPMSAFEPEVAEDEDVLDLSETYEEPVEVAAAPVEPAFRPIKPPLQAPVQSAPEPIAPPVVQAPVAAEPVFVPSAPELQPEAAPQPEVAPVARTAPAPRWLDVPEPAQPVAEVPAPSPVVELPVAAPVAPPVGRVETIEELIGRLERAIVLRIPNAAPVHAEPPVVPAPVAQDAEEPMDNRLRSALANLRRFAPQG